MEAMLQGEAVATRREHQQNPRNPSEGEYSTQTARRHGVGACHDNAQIDRFRFQLSALLDSQGEVSPNPDGYRGPLERTQLPTHPLDEIGSPVPVERRGGTTLGVRGVYGGLRRKYT